MAKPRKKPVKQEKQPQNNQHANVKKQQFHVEFLNAAQKLAWSAFDQHEILFLLGPAGCGKSHLACAFAISEILAKRKQKIVLTRPTVEAGGESLGFLPGTASEKVHPYMIPLYDCMDRCLGQFSPQRELVNKSIDLSPLCFMRGRTFHDAVCILDEAQNCNYGQIKLFLTRFGQNSKVIITGDPMQSDLHPKDRALMNVVEKLSGLKGVGVIHFKPSSIVRHPLIAGILERLEEKEENGSSST